MIKKIGLIISAIGFMVILFTGFRFDSKVSMNMKSKDVLSNKQQTLSWSPYPGIGILVIGLIVYAIGVQRK